MTAFSFLGKVGEVFQFLGSPDEPEHGIHKESQSPESPMIGMFLVPW